MNASAETVYIIEDDRDARAEAKKAGGGKAYSMMVRLRIPGGNPLVSPVLNPGSSCSRHFIYQRYRDGFRITLNRLHSCAKLSEKSAQKLLFLQAIWPHISPRRGALMPLRNWNER